MFDKVLTNYAHLLTATDLCSGARLLAHLFTARRPSEGNKTRLQVSGSAPLRSISFYKMFMSISGIVNIVILIVISGYLNRFCSWFAMI